MNPDAPVAEAPRESRVGTVRTYNYTINGETYELAISIVEKQSYKGRIVDRHGFSDAISGSRRGVRWDMPGTGRYGDRQFCSVSEG